MSFVIAARDAVEDTIRAATGISDLQYWGHTLTISDPAKGVIWPTKVEQVGKKVAIDFKVAIGLVAETPDAMQTKIGNLAAQLLGFGSGGFNTATGGVCSALEVTLTDSDGNTTRAKSMTAQMTIGAIRVNDMEGFTENSRESVLRGVKTSVAFVASVLLT